MAFIMPIFRKGADAMGIRGHPDPAGINQTLHREGDYENEY